MVNVVGIGRGSGGGGWVEEVGAASEVEHGGHAVEAGAAVEEEVAAHVVIGAEFSEEDQTILHHDMARRETALGQGN
eukprot:scaffold660482_cov43-Attheya_sp.AAC.2